MAKKRRKQHQQNRKRANPPPIPPVGQVPAPPPAPPPVNPRDADPPRRPLRAHIAEFWSRLHRTSILLFVGCFVGIVGLYILTPRINLFTIVISMIFAGLLLVPASFIRQSRFHYRYLLLNESASRFIAVLGSFLLGRILKMAESNVNIPVWEVLVWGAFFFGAIFAYCVSVFFTNDLKNVLNDQKRHKCLQKTIVYLEEPVLLEEGFGQKRCANTEDEHWYRFRQELDRITNRNIKVFLTFLFVTVTLIIVFAIRDTYYPNGELNGGIKV